MSLSRPTLVTSQSLTPFLSTQHSTQQLKPHMSRIKYNYIQPQVTQHNPVCRYLPLSSHLLRRYRHAAKTPRTPTLATINIGDMLLGIKEDISQLKQETVATHARIDRLDATLNARVIKIISGTIAGFITIAAAFTTLYNFYQSTIRKPVQLHK